MDPVVSSTGIRFNQAELIAHVLAGQVANPLLRGHALRIGREGQTYILPGSGGITLNRRVGDRAVGMAGDHVEPGASVRNSDRDGGRGAANRALLAFSCIGNLARVVSGPATGAVGTVTGKHGGINNVLIDFPPATLRRMRIGDRIQVQAMGQGLRLTDIPQVTCLNLSPRLLLAWGLRRHGGHLHVPVTHLVPSGLLGSGLGRSDGVLGDCDVQLSDPIQRDRYRLGTLRFGDLVAVWPASFAHGPSRQQSVVTIGVVVHSDSQVAGHGPGVTPLLVGPASLLRPSFSARANLASLLGLRADLAPLPTPSERERRMWRLGHVGRLPRKRTPVTASAG